MRNKIYTEPAELEGPHGLLLECTLCVEYSVQRADPAVGYSGGVTVETFYFRDNNGNHLNVSVDEDDVDLAELVSRCTIHHAELKEAEEQDYADMKREEARYAKY